MFLHCSLHLIPICCKARQILFWLKVVCFQISVDQRRMSGREQMVSTLGEMGFGPARAARALKATNYRVGQGRGFYRILIWPRQISLPDTGYTLSSLAGFRISGYKTIIFSSIYKSRFFFFSFFQFSKKKRENSNESGQKQGQRSLV